MRLSRKITIALILIILVSTPIFFSKEKSFLKITEISNSFGIKTNLVRIKNGNVVYVKCRFKYAGVFHNPAEKHGISAVVAELLCRKIGELSPEETTEKLKNQGIEELSIHALGDHLSLSFYVLKDKAVDALNFLAPVFTQPKFTRNDLEFVKNKYPTILDPKTADPEQLMFDKLLQLLYPNHNYGLNRTGTAEALSSVTESDVYQFVRENFTKKKLTVLFCGDLSVFETESFLKALFSQLPVGEDMPNLFPEDLTKYPVAEQKDLIIPREHLGNVLGVMCGMRLDKLNAREKAALQIIITTLFDDTTGDFCEGLRKKQLAYAVEAKILHRSLSSIFYFSVYIRENDLAEYKKYVEEKISSYQYKLNIKHLKRTREYFSETSQKGFISIRNIEEQIKNHQLPFTQLPDELFLQVARRLFEKIKIVYIGKVFGE
ncbi:MAG: insulinase family protein [Holosporaceae bacterium]|jgi:predicted Zn-dependent peptidase|nr:insulinase family protein [Holosporaceae bacterium]